MWLGNRAALVLVAGVTTILLLQALAVGAGEFAPAHRPGSVNPASRLPQLTASTIDAPGVSKRLLASNLDPELYADDTRALGATSIASVSTELQGSVSDTLVLWNRTVVAGNFLPANGEGPAALVYDGSDGYVFVANTGSNNLIVINGTTHAVIGAIPVASYPVALAYDSANGFVFVADEDSARVTVVNGSTEAIVGSVSFGFGSFPDALAYDSATGCIYVSEFLSDTVSIFNATSLDVVGSISVGTFPDAEAYDSANGFVYVADSGSAYVTAINGSTQEVAGNIRVGFGPSAIAYDSANKRIYVANEDSPGNVTVIDGRTDKVVASVNVGPYPDAVAFDSANRDIYVADDDFPGTVTVINGTSDTVRGSVQVGDAPSAAAFDSATKCIFVANWASDNATVIRGGSDTVTGWISIGYDPDAAAYDDESGFLFIADYFNSNVTVVNVSSASIVGVDSVGRYPDAVAFDPANGFVYVANYGSGNVTILNGSTLGVIGSVPVGSSPDAIVYDGENGELFVANSASENVTVLDGTDNRVVGSVQIGTDPSAVVYDAANGFVYVASWLSSDITVFDGGTDRIVGSIGSIPYPSALAYDPANGYIYVADATAQGSVTIINGAAPFNGSSQIIVGSVPVGAYPSAVTFDTANEYVYVANSGGSNVTVIDGKADAVAGVVPVGDGPDALAYDSSNGYIYTANGGSGSVAFLKPVPTFGVTISERGLPAGTFWAVYLLFVEDDPYTTTTGVLNLNVSNGSYEYAADTPNPDYNSPTGSLTMDGKAIALSVNFTILTYQVVFAESQLPRGTDWWVNISGQPSRSSTTNAISIDLPTGTYQYVAGSSNRNFTAPVGSFEVNFSSLSVAVEYHPVTFSTTFTESGLPTGTEWWVNVSLLDSSISSTTPSIGFSAQNGSYPYSITTANKEYAAAGGILLIDGVLVSLSVDFRLVTYDVIFNEIGLPQGTNWSVNVSAADYYSTESTLAALLPNGTFTFYVGPVSGYSVNRTNGSIMVEGAPVRQGIEFVPISRTTPFAGLVGPWTFLAIATIAATSAAVALFVTRLMKNRKKGVRLAQSEVPVRVGTRIGGISGVDAFRWPAPR